MWSAPWCAVEMQLAMRDLNLVHLRERLPQVYLGIGVNTGTVMAGRFGSDLFSQYTVIGEEVNLASRIEAFSLRGQVLISESTYQRSWNRVSATAPMQVYVKGGCSPSACGSWWPFHRAAEGAAPGVPAQPPCRDPCALFVPAGAG